MKRIISTIVGATVFALVYAFLWLLGSFLPVALAVIAGIWAYCYFSTN